MSTLLTIVRRAPIREFTMSNLDRRTMLKLAAALGADRAMPTTISPAEAALLLEQPPAFDGAMPQDRVDEADWQDPEEFAAALVGVGGVALDWFQDGAAEELAAYKQSAARMLAAFG